MSLSLSQLIKTVGIIKTAITDAMKDDHDSLERRMDGKLQAVANIYEGTQPLQTVKLVDETVGIQDEPVGTILTFMGTRAPSHYLICDGSEYEIDNYPILAEHIKSQWGSYYYFGGEGTKFRVPDLRGEFLRGSGQNPSRPYHGEEVGVHQEPTYGKFSYTDITNSSSKYHSNTFKFHSSDSTPLYEPAVMNEDAAIAAKQTTYSSNPTRIYTADQDWLKTCKAYAAMRPTNTSVLYCIKCEPTYYMIVNPQLELFDQNERKIGVWVDGRPIYRSLKQFTVTIMSENDYTHIFDISSLNADVIINYNGYCLSQTEDDMQSCFPISFVNSGTGVSNHIHSLSIGAYYKRIVKQLVLIIASDYVYRNNIFTTLNFMIFLDYVKNP